MAPACPSRLLAGGCPGRENPVRYPAVPGNYCLTRSDTASDFRMESRRMLLRSSNVLVDPGWLTVQLAIVARGAPSALETAAGIVVLLAVACTRRIF